MNETFARRYLAGVDPIGRRFVWPGNPEAGRPQTLWESPQA